MYLMEFSLPEEDIDLPKLYWIPKLHKNPYKQRYIAGSAKCSTKSPSQILTRILTTVKEGLQKYCDTACARSGVNQMWILKNSKEFLENLKAQSLHSVNSIKSFDFSTLYTTIPHDKLKSKLREIINQCFLHKNSNRRFQYVVIGYKDIYFVRDHSDAPQKYSDADVIKMLEYLIDNILWSSADGYFSKQSVFLKAGKKHLAQQFNFTYRYIDGVLSLNNTKFAEYLEFIYPRELEIKETTETAASSSFLDCYLYIDNGMLTTRLYDKRDDFNFPIVNVPFLSSNSPSAPVYGVYVSQSIRYARACSNYQDFMERGKVLTTKLLSQGYQKTKSVATLKKFYGRHHDLVNPYNLQCGSFQNCF